MINYKNENSSIKITQTILNTSTAQPMYKHYQAKPDQNEKLTDFQQRMLKNAFGLIFGGIELTLESGENLVKLMNENFNGVYRSIEYKNNKTRFANKLCQMLLQPETVACSLDLLYIFLSNSSDLDCNLLTSGNRDIFLQVFSNVSTDDMLCGYLEIITLIISRNSQFVHWLFSKSFYNFLSTLFYSKQDCVRIRIAKLVLKSTESTKDLTEEETTTILNMLSAILTAPNDSAIALYGLSILSKLPINADNILNLLINGSVISNLCNFLKSADPKSVTEIIINLSKFAIIGNSITAMMDKNECLQNVLRILNWENFELIMAIFDLIINWLEITEEQLNSPFNFLKSLNFCPLFDYGEFKLKAKAMNIFKMASIRFSANQIFELISPKLFSIITYQIEDCDDPTITTDGCIFIQNTLSKSGPNQNMKDIQLIMRRSTFVERLNQIILNNELSIAEVARCILCFINEAHFK